ncbi:hypothetical protein D5038_05480 [Verminephrobacter aporrectodeae subsp. tuberculatae]|uniref:hypothetical protein n=1 Tax=Verminephrobacter aporrectodeae TaxID=1110389 RepID=UPI002237043F|nr:hypothetical protein [Verminephrobacter aporrectodeae]MCW5255822.1 hypothetical protein [Verminephrobacter aporrectodeae subsp. tuberculatae]
MKKEQEILKRIKLRPVAGAKLDALIQDEGIDVLKHFDAHHDVRLVNRFYCELSNDTRKNAVRAWLLAFAGVIANTNSLTKKEAPFINFREKMTDVDGARSRPWFLFKPDAAPDKVFDLQRMVQAMLKRAAEASDWKGATAEQLRTIAVVAGIDTTTVPTMPVHIKKRLLAVSCGATGHTPRP